MNFGISFDRPSNRYEEALPIGNGALGAMVSGSIAERQIWINEETVWFGGPRNRINPDARPNMPKIRKLVREGRLPEAERLAVMALTGVPESQRHYTTLGMVVLSFFHHNGTPSNYQHSLDFATATTTTSYTLDGVDYTMTTFASAPDSAIAIKITASEPVLDFFAGIERGERVPQFSYGTHQDDSIRVSDHGVLMTGSCGGKQGLDFVGGIYGKSNGDTYLMGDKIIIQNASVAELFITAATSFHGKDPMALVMQQASAARDNGYDTCYRHHIAEWGALYGRVELELADLQEIVPSPMNRLFDAFASEDYQSLPYIRDGGTKESLDDYLTLLLFHFGRYALLSSSRNCELPANLQGIWCQDLLPTWDGKYTTNINLQMNYWPADSVNMGECFEPYIRHAERIRLSGLKTAQEMYGCRGFVLHNNTDLWADTAVQDSGTHCSYWFLGGVWIAADMYEHYCYTKDSATLARIWPILRDAALFVLDYMEEIDGELVMGVTSSPENFYFSDKGERVSFCQMTAMDTQLIRYLFDACVEASSLLNGTEAFTAQDAAFVAEVLAATPKLAKSKIAADGTIMEWGIEVAEAEPQHRHLSHLIGAYPYNNITERQPALYQAVEKSLEKRIRNGGCNTGWGRAWGAGLMARLKRGDDARDMINTMVQYSGQPNLMSCCNIGRIPKLLDNNKPMQIDGTMGTVQAVAELLVQSYHAGEVQILPALPSSWKNGHFTGLVARGNLTISANWCDGKLASATISTPISQEITITCPCEFTLKTATEAIASAQGKVQATLVAGTVYEISALS